MIIKLLHMIIKVAIYANIQKDPNILQNHRIIIKSQYDLYLTSSRQISAF